MSERAEAVARGTEPRPRGRSVRDLHSPYPLARGLNAMMGGTGSIFVDRYHLRALKTPSEVKQAIAYVLGNHRRHAAQWGKRAAALDEYSSAAAFDGWKVAPAETAPPPDGDPPPVSEPSTWLLRVGWRLRGLIDPAG